jgi:sugar phosphate isomerase/epimerase
MTMAVDPATVFVSTTFVPGDMPIGRAIEACVDHGLRSLELGSTHPFEPAPLDVVRQYPLRYLVHNYFPPPEAPLVVNLASLDDDIYRRSRAHVERSLEFCAGAGALLYTVHPGFLSDPSGPGGGNGSYDFLFSDAGPARDRYERAYARMSEALAWTVERASAIGVRVAIETEGSVTRPDHLLLQRPAEYQRLFTRFSPGDLGINLNLGHLNLASAAFGFAREAFVDTVADYVVALEMSHNDGATDDHRLLRADGWYWAVIADRRFADAYKVLEVRDARAADVAACAEMIAHCGS